MPYSRVTSRETGLMTMMVLLFWWAYLTVFPVPLTEIILLADSDALKDLLHLFLGGGQLHPLTDQHTLVVLSKVRDEGFKITV